MDTIKLTLALVALTLIVIPSVGECQPGIRFTPSSTNAVGNNPYSIATGDFNGDGNPDFVTANIYDDTITVGLGYRNGTFGALSNYSVGPHFSTGLRRVATADLNRDGLTDVFVTYGYEFGRIAVFTATNGGALLRHADVFDSRYCSTLGFGDFDGDGNLDFVVSGYAGSFVTIHFGDGRGAFPTSTNLNISSFADCVAAGDLNGDGRPDVLVGSATIDSPSLLILLNQPDGSFITATNLPLLHVDDPTVRAIAVADFDGDDSPDIAVGFEDQAVLTVVLRREGAFTVWTNYVLNAEAFYCVTADFNGDGFPDLATEADLLLGKGNGEFLFPRNGEFVPPHDEDDEFPSSVAVADLSRDGRPDILWTFGSVFCSTNNTRPSLQIEKTEDQVRVSWPPWDAFSLQTATNISVHARWTAVTNGVTRPNGRNVLAQPADSPAMCFRLGSN
jgi:hypothetical protein